MSDQWALARSALAGALVASAVAVLALVTSCGAPRATVPSGVPPTGAIGSYHWPTAPAGCRWEWSWDGQHWRAGHWTKTCR